MLCPECAEDGISFWRVWLLNLRQKITCNECETLFLIHAPDKIAIGTVGLLLLSGSAFFLPGGNGLGLILLLLGIVANFVLTHHLVELIDPDKDADTR